MVAQLKGNERKLRDILFFEKYFSQEKLRKCNEY